MRADFRKNGSSYAIIIRPWKRGNKRYECLKWKTGLFCTWERISVEEYHNAKKQTPPDQPLHP